MRCSNLAHLRTHCSKPSYPRYRGHCSERDCVSFWLPLPTELHLYPNSPFLHHKCHTLNECTAQFEMGFGSVCSIHSAATLAPADVPMAIIKTHKYPHHKVGVSQGKVDFRLMVLQCRITSQRFGCDPLRSVSAHFRVCLSFKVFFFFFNFSEHHCFVYKERNFTGTCH